ncbi:MAG: dsDNA-binding SOS-regulon protein [Urechidicola sp.]
MLSLPLLENLSFSVTEIESIQQFLRQAKVQRQEESKETIVAVLAKIKQKVLVDDVDFLRTAELLRGLIDDRQSHTDHALVELGLLQESDQFDSTSIERLRRNVMFFVSIADAENKEAIKNILEVYTLPAVSFAEKRKLVTVFLLAAIWVLARRIPRCMARLKMRQAAIFLYPLHRV